MDGKSAMGPVMLVIPPDECRGVFLVASVQVFSKTRQVLKVSVRATSHFSEHQPVVSSYVTWNCSRVMVLIPPPSTTPLLSIHQIIVTIKYL